MHYPNSVLGVFNTNNNLYLLQTLRYTRDLLIIITKHFNINHSLEIVILKYYSSSCTIIPDNEVEKNHTIK